LKFCFKYFLVSLILVSCGENTKEIKSFNDKNFNDSLIYLNHSDSAKYVGMNTCKLCHQNIYNTFIETGMGQSFGIASKTKSLAKFKNACIKDKSTNYNYCAYWQKDSLYIKEFLLEKNDTIYNRTEQVNYIIGSGQHTNSHLQNVNGYLNQMPMTFFTQKQQWDLPPGFENGFNTRFSRKIGLECMSCHNAYPDFVIGSENKYKSIPIGIDCERCHGPGSIHVAERSTGSKIDTSKFIDYTIVNPSKLSIDLQFDICQRCHLQGNAILNDNKSFYDFKPGKKLSDYISVFLPKYSNAEDEFIMASHADRLKQSACFIKSNKNVSLKIKNIKPYKNGLTCITCHNPHVSVKHTEINVFNNACINCHNPNKNQIICTDLKINKLYKQNNLTKVNCVNCHMPKSGSTDIPHVTVHDHYIRKPINKKDKDGIKTFLGLIAINNKTPEIKTRVKAFLNQYEKFEKNNFYLDSAYNLIPKQEANYKQIYISELVQYNFIKHNHKQITILISELGIENVINNILNKQSYDNQHAWTLYRIAESFCNINNLNTAEQFFDACIKLAPYQLDMRIKYATTLANNKKLPKAIEQLEFVLKENPKIVTVYTNLGYLYLMAGDTIKCEKYYLIGEKLDPNNVALLMNLGGYYANFKQYNKAKLYFKRVLKLENNNTLAKQMLNNLNYL
jgi:tetratricopeptide (TPR) repeat protein